MEKILKEQKIDAVLPTMGGQTALNLCIEADKGGLWEEYGVKIIGVDINAINITEDREQFRVLMNEIGIGMAPSQKNLGTTCPTRNLPGSSRTPPPADRPHAPPRP